MPMIIVTKWFGVFLVDKDKVVRSILFDKNPNTIAQKLSVVQRGEILPEEEQLAGKHIHVAEARMSSWADRNSVILHSFTMKILAILPSLCRK